MLFSDVLGRARSDPAWRDRRVEAVRGLAEANRRAQSEEAARQDQRDLRAFKERRDDALFHAPCSPAPMCRCI